MNKKKIAALAAMAMVAGLVGVPGSASAAEPRLYHVQVFGELQGAPAFDTRFFPGELTVHPGDTLHFFETVIVLEAGMTELPEELAKFVVANPDSNSLKFNLQLFFPEVPVEGCGTEADPCIYDGSMINFGDPESFPHPGFYLRIPDDMDGTTFHVSNIFDTMAVTVDSTADQSPDSDPDVAQKLAQASAAAKAKHQALQKATFKKLANGKRRYNAYAGFEEESYVLFGMYPRRLEIRRGDRVRWHFSQNFELHTASMPGKRAVNIADRAFNKMFGPGGVTCDPDGDGPLRGEPMGEEGCPEGTEPEVNIPRKMAMTQGDGVFPNRKRDFESSGLRGHSTPTVAPFNVRFRRSSGDGGYAYACMFHAFLNAKGRPAGMVGKVFVK